MKDAEVARRELLRDVNSNTCLEELRKEHGQVWTTDDVQKEFTVLGFLAPMVVVFRKSTGERGTLMFTHSPRYYYGFEPE